MTRRIGALAATLALVLLGAAGAADSGFTSLFDGQTLGGWTPEHTDRFTVRAGVLFGNGGIGWLRSAKPYKDFELEAEYRALTRGAESGLLFRAAAESTPKEPFWPVRSYEIQISDAESNLKVFGHGTPPPTSDRKADALKAVMKPPGEWQKVTLKVIGTRAEATLNGTPITLSDAIGLPEGYVGIQGENGQFEWRGLRIKELTIH